MADLPGPFPEKADKTELSEEAVQAAIDLIPWVGPALGRLVGYHWVTTLERRQSDWHNKVNDALVDHIGRIEGIEARVQSDEFLTLYLRASRAAAATHAAETREALKNAVVNAALGVEEEDWQNIFVDLASELGPSHLRLLAFYDDPAAHLSEEELATLKAATGKRLIMITESAQSIFSDWSPEYFAQIHNDLLTAQLLNTIALKTISEERSQKTSQKGRRFLAFISES